MIIRGGSGEWGRTQDIKAHMSLFRGASEPLPHNLDMCKLPVSPVSQKGVIWFDFSSDSPSTENLYTKAGMGSKVILIITYDYLLKPSIKEALPLHGFLNVIN